MMSIGWPLGTNVCSTQRNANTKQCLMQQTLSAQFTWAAYDNLMLRSASMDKGIQSSMRSHVNAVQVSTIRTISWLIVPGIDMHWQQFTHNWNLCAFWNTFQWHWPAQVAKPGTSSVILLLRINLQVMSELGNTLLSQKVDQDPGPNYQDLPAFSGKLLSPWQEACPCSSTALRWVLADWRHLTSVLVMNKILNLIPRLAPFG